MNIFETKNAPFLIAGPCSAESEEQVVSVCKDIKSKSKVSMLRAGIWKPRTRPDSFEGVGEIGLEWLIKAGKETSLPVTTEVANSTHVELALKAGVDVFWVGARTSVNPFAVQEIADALKGTNIPVMVKNPINPDLNLWVGAIERMRNAGVEEIAAIHRGFSVYKHPKYRNIPNWEIPIGLKEIFPDIPLICDPSHISGRRDGLLEVSQKALDLNFHGLMIETHPNPDKAWSDAQQQVNPNALKKILSELKLRSENLSEKAEGFISLKRGKIAELDDKLFNLMMQRMRIAEEIGIYKRENDITILQQEHWKKVINQRLGQADELNLTTSFVRNVMDAIHQESIRHQTKVMNPDLK